MEIRKYGIYEVELTNTNKILFPESNITKGDLINYYANIANHMIYFMKNHPVTMQRFPEGINKTGFFQKDAPDYFPTWIPRAPFEKKDGSGVTNYILCNNQATLVYLANLACITSHIWLSEYIKPYIPDKVIFDLDPSTSDFGLVRFAALELKKIIENKKLIPFAMVTGSSGIHISIPIAKKYTFDQTKAFAQTLALELIRKHPDKFTLEIRKEKRGKRLFIDTLRNNYSATAVTPYAVRAKEHAPIAAPIFWKEVENPKLTAQKYTINNIFDKLKSEGNPWENFHEQIKELP